MVKAILLQHIYIEKLFKNQCNGAQKVFIVNQP